MNYARTKTGLSSRRASRTQRAITAISSTDQNSQSTAEVKRQPFREEQEMKAEREKQIIVSPDPGFSWSVPDYSGINPDAGKSAAMNLSKH